MISWFVRIIFALLVASLMVLGFREKGPFAFETTETFGLYKTLAIFSCMAILVFGLMVDLFLPRKRLATFAGVFFGILIGLLIGAAFNKIIEFAFETYNITASNSPDLFMLQQGLKWLISVLCIYLAIIFILQTKDDFRFIIPYVEFSKQTKGTQPLILDTSVIIDGRIADIASTKILNAPMIIPRFILNELQMVADSADRLRRNRGRRGLDMLNKLQTNPQIDLDIRDIRLKPHEQNEPIDLQLVAAAQQLSGKIVTNDYNLNKVASLRGIEVININDLANALKPVIMPGEAMHIKIIKPGDQPGQGVGYLDDGTMVVVEQGRDLIGKEVDVAVTSVLQTSAGRMIFGKTENQNSNTQNYRSNPSRPSSR